MNNSGCGNGILGGILGGGCQQNRMASVSRETTAAPGESIFEVRGLFKLSKGDIITVSNIGAATLTLGSPTPTNSYNVSTIINRLSN